MSGPAVRPKTMDDTPWQSGWRGRMNAGESELDADRINHGAATCCQIRIPLIFRRRND